MKMRGRCSKKGGLVENLTREIQARRLAKLGEETDEVLTRLLRNEATLGDLATLKRAVPVMIGVLS